jgi:hypothetical protein
MGACAGGFYETLPAIALDSYFFLAPVGNPAFNKRLIRVRREFLSYKAGSGGNFLLGQLLLRGTRAGIFPYQVRDIVLGDGTAEGIA